MDPMVLFTEGAYGYVGDNPINFTDMAGLGFNLNPLSAAVSVWNDTGGKAVSIIHEHCHGVIQTFTYAVAGVGTAFCILASDGLCALALLLIGGVTNDAIYAEGGGGHSARGYAFAFGEGGVGGSLALICLAACEFVGPALAGGIFVNGTWGAAQGIWDYSSNSQCRSFRGYFSAGVNGFAQGAIPWDDIFKVIRPN
jgi:hypothetical protein